MQRILNPTAPVALLALVLISGCVCKPPAFAAEPDPNKAAEKKIEKGTNSTTSINLFNGKDLAGWKENDFGGRGVVSVKDGVIELSMGAELTGFRWTNSALVPKANYEIELDAMKREGNDFFCGLTFPVNDSFCTLIIGGWGGSVVGISSLDGGDASENDTSTSLFFERNRWYHIRLQVRPDKIKAWIDKDNIVDVGIAGRKVSMRIGDIELSKPLGIATWQTSASYKNLTLKSIPPETDK